MATNVIISTQPQTWCSAYDDIEFIFDFKTINISTSSNPSGTTTRITTASNFDVLPPINSYVYIDSGIYVGLWRVLASTVNTVDLDVTYTAVQSTGTIKSLRLPTFGLYKGFKTGEQFETPLPYELVTQFTHTFNSNYQIKINLKGLLQRIFTISEPDITQDYDISVFNAYRLVWDTSESTDIRYCLNCSIPTDELNSDYLVGNRYLTNTEQPLMWGCGVSFMTKFVDGFPKLEIYNGGNQATTGFSAAFVTSQFSQGFNIQ